MSDNEAKLRQAWETWFACYIMLRTQSHILSWNLSKEQAEGLQEAFRQGWAGAKLS